MNIPERIKIGGIIFAIKYEEKILLRGGESVVEAKIDFRESEIVLNPECKKQFLGVCLWHEILHALAESMKLELGENEENIIDAFAHGIYQVLVDNKNELFKEDE